MGLDEIREVYDQIDHLEGEGYSCRDNKDLKELNVNDMIYCILICIVPNFCHKTGRYI